MKERIKEFIENIYYHIHLLLHRGKPEIAVMSVDDTIQELVSSEKSLVRFGDGELTLIRGIDLSFQKYSKDLGNRLSEVLGYQNDDLMVSINDIFGNLDFFIPKSRVFWKDHLFFYKKYYLKYCNPARRYANTSFSRFYVTVQDKSKCAEWIKGIKDIWKNRSVILVEGEKSLNGVGNDLFEKASEVKRILCPPTSAWEHYDTIRNECRKQDKDKLFLLSLGPSAKPLAEDLFHDGYRVIDIGNLDSEYEWYRMKADDKANISKHSLHTKEELIAAGFQEYVDQIIAVIR